MLRIMGQFVIPVIGAIVAMVLINMSGNDQLIMMKAQKQQRNIARKKCKLCQ